MSSQSKPHTVSITTVFIICSLVSFLTYAAASRRFQSYPVSVPTKTVESASLQPDSPIQASTVVEGTQQDEYQLVRRVLEPNLLQLDDGTKVILLGIEAPDKDDNAFREALAFSQGALEGRKIRLEYETGSSDKTSKAYVYFEDGTLLNAALLKKGYGSCATTYAFGLKKDFGRYEAEARDHDLGLWAVDESEYLSDSTTETPEAEVTLVSPTRPQASSIPSGETPPPSRPRTYTPSSPLETSSTSQVESIESAPTPYYAPPRSVYNPPVAENGSYYGQISEATGRPKTVSVRGYTRSDGTYVRGHYRSAPRRR